MDPLLTKIAKIRASGSFAIAGIIMSATLIFNYLIGILQSLERFYAIGLLFFSAGLLNIILGFALVSLDLGVVFAYGAQALAIILVLAVAVFMINRILPREGVASEIGRFSVSHFSLLAVTSIGIFFILYNMDVIASKVLFDRRTAGYYARMALIGKVSFLLASSLALIIFPKVSKAYDSNENPAPYLFKGTVSFLGMSLVGLVCIIAFAKIGSPIIFGEGFVLDIKILFLIVFAGIFQSYIFILLNYGTAIIDKGIVYCMLGLLALQSSMFILNHSSLIRIGINMFVPSLLGAIYLLFYMLKRPILIEVKDDKEECRAVRGSSYI
jgi:O-antigen/teichoic acid export membrane protein